MSDFSRLLVNRWGLPEDASVVTAYFSVTPEGGLSGQLLNPYIERPISLKSLDEMLLFMDLIYNYLDYPCSPTPPATFFELPSAEKKAVKRPNFHRYRDPGTGNTAPFQFSFEIRVRTREAESWQGSVLWKEKDLRHSFSSALQLLHLVSDALGLPRLR